MRDFLSARCWIQLNCCVVLQHPPDIEVLCICSGGFWTAGAGRADTQWTCWTFTQGPEWNHQLCWCGGDVTQLTRIWWNLGHFCDFRATSLKVSLTNIIILFVHAVLLKNSRQQRQTRLLSYKFACFVAVRAEPLCVCSFSTLTWAVSWLCPRRKTPLTCSPTSLQTKSPPGY